LGNFHPAYRFTALPTTVTTLEPVRETSLQDCLRYVYLNKTWTSQRACLLLKLWYNTGRAESPAPAVIEMEARTMLGFDRITFDPDVMGGRACIRGMRITVSLIVNLVANGMNTKEILTDYPYLESDDIRQALAYAAWLADESVHALELTAVWDS
jgi:uncharacterized protein (DUF433 family)